MLPDQNDYLLRVAEAAALLGCSQASVYRWITEGRLPFVRLGRAAVRIPRGTLLAHIQGMTVAPTTPTTTVEVAQNG